MFRLYYFLTYLFIRIFYPCRVINRKNYIKNKPAIIICNHLSNIDPVYILSYFYDKKYVLAKKELFKGKIKSSFFKSLGAIRVDRQGADLTAIKTCFKVLKNNKKLVIFPEGTRNKKDESLQDVKNGSAMIAIKCKVPIIPMIIEKRAKIFRRNKIIVGESFEFSDFYGQKLTSEVLDEASNIIAQKLMVLKNNIWIWKKSWNIFFVVI